MIRWFLLQKKCLTSLTWLRLLVLTRQSWRRRRQKKKTLCPPKRVSVHKCYWSVLKPWCNNFPVSFSSSFLVQTQQFGKQMKQSAATSAHQLTCSTPVTYSLNFCFSFPCSHWAREERRCHALRYEHMKKGRQDATAKSTFLWLLQCFKLLLCLRIRVLLSPMGGSPIV